MKHLKTYESNNDYKVGGYTILNTVIDFCKDKTGQITEKSRYKINYISVRYKTDNPKRYRTFTFKEKDILFYSENEIDCEAYLNSKKFNI